MGGPGFFGLRLGAQWLVVAIWGAAEWIMAGDRAVGDWFHQEYGRPRPWITHDGDGLSERVVGRGIAGLEIERHSLRLSLDSGFALWIEQSPERRPVFEGTKEPRAFAEEDDLRRVVFLSPTNEIWV
jgi:hypothetical protein